VITSRLRNLLGLALGLAGWSLAAAQTPTPGTFSEPADGGNLDLTQSTFDGSVAYLVPRWHESEAIGTGAASRRWRNVLFALHGVRGQIVTFHLPARPVESGAMIHNMDSATINLVEPVWSYQHENRSWNAFTMVDCMVPDAADTVGAAFPTDSIVDNSGHVVLKASALRREDYGWVFRNTTPFTEDVVYVSINEHYGVHDYYGWLESSVFPHAWVSPTSSEASPGTFLIGYQSGAPGGTPAFDRPIPDMPLYSFKIQDPSARPTKLVLLVTGQHPYEGQTKAALQGAVEWILDPEDPAAAAYRAEYVTLVYPFVNPTGELAGLWRGTAYDPRRDTNRNWHTEQTDPLADRGIDTVIIHKQAMLRDVTALGLGQPYAVVDLHQNFGDQLPALHYVLHNTNALATAWVQRLQERVEIADIVSNPATNQTLRSFWQSAGAALSLCIERSTYSTLAKEHTFGREMMRTFAPDAIARPPAPLPVVELVPATLPAAVRTAEVVLRDGFGGAGALDQRAPDGDPVAEARWRVELGEMMVTGGAAVAANTSTRALIDTGTIDGAVEADLQLPTDQALAGLVFRAVDRDNFYFFRVQTTGWTFGRVVSNTATVLASGRRALPMGLTHRLRAELNGNDVVLMVQDTVVHTASITTEPGATHVGLASGSPYSFISDNFTFGLSGAAGRGTEGGPSGAAATSPPGVIAGPLHLVDSFDGRGGLQGRAVNESIIGAPLWQVALGAFTVEEGRVTAGSTVSRAFLDAGVTDARVTAEVSLEADGSYSGLTFRGMDRDNFHYFRLQANGWQFGQILANTAYPIASGTRAFPLGRAVTLQAECAGGLVTLRINGRVVHVGPIEAPQASATRFGFSSGSPLPFSVQSFSIDAGATISTGGEGDGVAVLPASTPERPRVQRAHGPAGRSPASVRRPPSLSAMRAMVAD
jgi:hypothetical protein